MKILSILAAAAAIVAVPSLAQAKGGVTFLIVGDTYSRPFSFSNTSDAGEKLVGFGFDLSTITHSNYVFDTTGTQSQRFAPVGTSAALTGLVSVPVVPDQAKSFSLAFNDFDVGEQFQFDIDVDLGAANTSIHGDDLIGARVWFDYSDGTRAEGFLRAVPGQSNASTFVTERIITSGVPEPASWALMIGGFGLAGVALRQRRGSPLAAC